MAWQAGFTFFDQGPAAGLELMRYAWEAGPNALK